MRKLYLLAILFISWFKMFGVGAPSTYFNIYCPPNNDAIKRNVALIVTAIYDSTSFEILDDNSDGDDDDSVSGMLMAGQSYILYIKDNGINDDAQYASGGILKQDGDYFTITSNKIVYASMSTDSDWQHDFVPATNKTSLGQKFIIYAPKISSSNRDLNVFAFVANTTITISKISSQPKMESGYTQVDSKNKVIIKQRTLNPGEDIIHFFDDGRDVMESGETYMIESNKPVSVQYGALWSNARDGGAYVPSSNGSSSGSVFYFAVPYQSPGEQEIRYVSWDDNNRVTLERYEKGQWIVMRSESINRLEYSDWIGKKNGNATYPTVFRIQCTEGKKVSVFECNWMETGSPGTSDMASMVSSEDGTVYGNEFLAYLLPPGNQNNVRDPFTGKYFGGQYSHLYLYAGNKKTTVTIKDANTNGSVINRSYTIEKNRYADAYFSLDEWKSIYNGTGNPDSGPERPYVLIESDFPIALMNANTNDNWMMYFGSSLENSFSINTSSEQSIAIPGDTVIVVTTIQNGSTSLENPDIEMEVSSGAIPVNSVVKKGGQTWEGDIIVTETSSLIEYDYSGTVNPHDTFSITTKAVVTSTFTDGQPIPDNTVISFDAQVTDNVNGIIEQASTSLGIQNNSSNTSRLLFTECDLGDISNDLTDSWNPAWIDFDNDGWEDLFIADKSEDAPNRLYRNNGDHTFTRIINGIWLTEKEKTVAGIWGDLDNDGYPEVMIINATGNKSRLFKNDGGNFKEIDNSGIEKGVQYFHGGSFFDFDNDGFLDLLLTNFFETRFHQLYKNNGDLTFTKVTNTPITKISNRSTAPALADYNNDGLVDIFISNGKNEKNVLFKNIGNGNFQQILTGDIVNDQNNTVGACWGDYNNDGWMDLMVLNASGQDNLFYKNDGMGGFTKMTKMVITQEGGDSHGGVWVDQDNDGDLDLYVTNDVSAKFHYLNDGKENFARKYDELIVGNFGYTMGVAAADYDKDGDVDLFIATHSHQKNRLYCNTTSENHFVSIKLNGTVSNKSAIGATIRLKAGNQWQTRQVLPVQGLGSQSSLRQHFGLGTSTVIDSIIIRWPSGYLQKLSTIKADQFMTITEEPGNQVIALVFEDKNGNCMRDEEEATLENIALSVNPSGLNLASGAGGLISTSLARGQYTISLDEDKYWSSLCEESIDINTDNGEYKLEIPVFAAQSGVDLSVSTGITAWRRGFSNSTILTFRNNGTNDAHEVVVKVKYPEDIGLVNADLPWDLQEQTEYTWYIKTLRAGTSRSIALQDSVYLSTKIGESYAIESSITSSGTELKKDDNQFIDKNEIVGAIDPNDILVSPKGIGSNGFINRDQQLTYTIRFQNVGTFYASRIILENKVPENLDLGTFKIESVSHDYLYSIGKDGSLRVVFHDINLPDSTTNEKGSHGFFKYSIFPKNDIQGGASIENSVLIYFDYEDPMESNTVLNTIKYSNNPDSYELVVFPSPVETDVYFSIDEAVFDRGASPLLTIVSLFNSQGREIMRLENQGDYLLHFQVADLPSGTYYLRGMDNQGAMHRGKFVKL